MTDEGEKGPGSAHTLTPQPGVRQLVSRAIGSRLMSRVTHDAITTVGTLVAAEKEKTWRIGDYEFGDGAYQQLLRWLCAIQSPEGPRTVDALVEHLQESFDADEYAQCYTSSWIIDGHLKAVVLRSLGMHELDLSNAPDLCYLDCGGNELTQLDLSNVPELAVLLCTRNRLSYLDLSNVCGLIDLTCWGNGLTELDLSNVPALVYLECEGNELTKIDLSNIPRLTVLRCDYNPLTEIDLSDVPDLENLSCCQNRLAE